VTVKVPDFHGGQIDYVDAKTDAAVTRREPTAACTSVVEKQVQCEALVTSKPK
jgi:hypothetical protein